jgi:hypothetical protein
VLEHGCAQGVHRRPYFAKSATFGMKLALIAG